MKKHILAVVLMGTVVVAPAAVAADMGWYLGANAGQSRFDASSGDLDSTWRSLGFTASSSVDDTDTGFKLFAGYKFMKYFAVEGGYVDLGKLTFSSNITAAPAGYSTGSVSGDIKTKNGVFIDAVGIVPVTDAFSVFGRLGAYSIKAEFHASGPAGSVDQNETGSDVHYGIGAGYNFTKNIGARLEWERFRNVGDESKTGEGDVDLWSVGLAYMF